MTTEAIKLICEKLGTTVENFVPTVIAYSKHGIYVQLSYSIPILVVGIICIVAATVTLKSEKYYEFMDLPISLVLGATFCTAIGIIWTLVNIYYLHMWNTFPTIRAYETVLRWIGSGK